MASIFDGLTVSAPALGAGTSPVPEPDAIPPMAVPQMPTSASPSALRTLPQVTQPVTAVGSTGLLARVEPEEFVKIVTNAGTGIVLYTPQINPNAQRSAIDRYVASVSGIVFITIASRVLKFPSTVQVVNAAAVLCDSRPLSNQDKM
jgi:hypothetical protein